MNFSEHPPSQEWAALKYRGERIAEVWFKPEGEPFALAFRIPRKSFEVPELRQRLTAENLLKAVAIANEAVESWHHDGVSDAGIDAHRSELGDALPPPPQGDSHVSVHVRLKPPAQAAGRVENYEPAIPPEKWQDVQARWNAILVLEAALESLRLSMESLRAEMEAASRHTLATEDKQHALSADMAQWNQLKSRLVYALPKAREFIHRSVWALGTPERKELGEFFKIHEHPDMSAAELEHVQKQMDYLLKDRQVLSAQGTTVHQEGKRITADVQGALRNLRSNAAANAQRKKGAARTQRKKG